MTAGSLVLGVVNGMLIAVLAVGIVLVYKSNRFLNLAHAQLGALSAQLLAKFVIDWGWNWWVAFAVCVPVGAGVGLVVERVVVRPLRARSASAVSLLLVTIGVTEVLLSIAFIPALGPDKAKLVLSGYPVPFHAAVPVGGVILGGADVMVLALVPVLVLSLGALLRFTMVGKMIRAAASNPDAARLSGVSIPRISRVTWALAGGLSAVAAILQSPSQSAFDAAALGPELLLLALGAAALGAFTSIPGALAGGLFIGLAQQITLAITSSAGTSEVVVFGVILVIVLARGRAIGRVFSAGGAVVEDRPPLRIPAAVRDLFVVRYHRAALWVAALVVGVLAPVFPLLRSNGKRFELSLVLVYALVAVSLSVAIGWAGQLSLGQFGLVGAGAFVAAKLINHGWSAVFLLLVCGGVGALVMVLVGLPALRVPGLTLAVTTLGFAVIAPDWLFGQGWFGTTRAFGIDISPAALASGAGHLRSQLAIYYLALAVLVACGLGMAGLRRSQPGRLVIAVRDNEGRASNFGVTPATIKLAALSVSGFLAGAAGVLWATAWRTVSAAQFSPELSLAILAAPVIGGIGSVAGGAVGALVVYLPAFFLSPYLGRLFGSSSGNIGFELLFGGIGLIVAIRSYPNGIVGALQAWWQSYLHRLDSEVATHHLAAGDGSLQVEGVTVSFGGLRALDGASISVGAGEIVGLIGPNGAGKTTLMNVISGALRPQCGSVVLGGVDASAMPTEVRSAIGLTRSFQDARLFPGLTVTEAIQVAMNARYRLGFLSSMVAAPWVREAETDSRRAALELAERFGLEPWADTLTSDLSTGTRRICDLATQVAAGPKIVLLDEPTAGVAQREAEAFGPLVRRIREELGCSILVIEHDMPLLMGLCDRVYALEAGRVIAEGTPDEIRRNPAVVASYLGADGAAISRSGRRATASGSRRRAPVRRRT